jgi:hypothetical protein
LARQFLGRDLGETGDVQANISNLQGRRSKLLLVASTHLASWLFEWSRNLVDLQTDGARPDAACCARC